MHQNGIKSLPVTVDPLPYLLMHENEKRDYPSWAMTSTSASTPRGKSFTATQEREMCIRDSITVDGINAAMNAATSESYGYNEDMIVSSDVIGMRYGSLFDATQTMVTKIDDDTYQVQVVAWYDNENSYTSQMVRTIKYFAEI